MATLTFAYAAGTAVVGPLATAPEPHSYDLCADHAASFTAPQGWDIVRPDEAFTAPGAGPDDLEALADAVREAENGASGDDSEPPVASGRRGHLRVLRFPEQ